MSADTEQLELESPFNVYCQSVDQEALLSDKGLNFYNEIVFKQYKEDPYFFTNLLIKDFKYREQHGLNVIISIGGEQGTFKSMGGTWLAIVTGEIYKKSYVLAKNMFVVPEEFEKNVRLGENRSTWLLDEQRNKNVGSGAQASQWGLQDFEEQCRYTQKNLILISPNVKPHSHYFVLISQDDITRVNNTRFCSHCPQDIRVKCMQEKFDTFCPDEFQFLQIKTRYVAQRLHRGEKIKLSPEEVKARYGKKTPRKKEMENIWANVEIESEAMESIA